jgi:hypothetical protein
MLYKAAGRIRVEIQAAIDEQSDFSEPPDRAAALVPQPKEIYD